jgi:CRISPR-associated protein Cas2
MTLVIVVARDVADRFTGFLASLMLEIAPNVFVSPRMNKGVRQRMWEVVRGWHVQEPRGSLVMLWRDRELTGGVGLAHLGTPSRELVEMDGMWLTRYRKLAG